MKRLNNKGYMLIEIILATVLTMVIVYFITELTVKLKNKNDDILVKTLASTDQAIIYNTIMEELDYSEFNCEDIKIDDNVFEYKEFTNIISEYVIVGNIECNKNEDGINIYVPLSIKQLPDDNFDVRIKLGI